MAGFHFNSAMFRISAVFDRLPRAFAGCPHGEACCEHGAAAQYRKAKGKAWPNQQLHDIRKEVNSIKHEAIGVYRGTRANLNAALAAVNQVLDLAAVSNVRTPNRSLQQRTRSPDSGETKPVPTMTFDVPEGALSALQLSPTEFVKEMRVAARCSSTRRTLAIESWSRVERSS
jgi:uncharacterized membrane protein